MKKIILHVLLGILTICTRYVISDKSSALSAVVGEIEDLKDLKKLLRTKNNVLVLFVKSKDSENLPKIRALFADVSQKLTGKATFAVVNCLSEEGKKTCKNTKLKVERDGKFSINHFNNGEFNKVYDRKLTVESLTRFLLDPTGETPWEEENDSKDVFHVQNAQAWKKFMKKEKLPVLAMFYAPWCGFCKKLKPSFSSAASDLKNASILAALDVTRAENYELQQLYNITGFPTLLYFKNGNLLFPYGGDQTKEGIIKWMKNPTAGSTNPGKVEELSWSDEQSDVVHLTDENFDQFLAHHPSVLVMFYAPWCGHCKAMKPAYTEAAKLLKEQKSKGVLAALDATKAKETAAKFEVKGFPTLKYFKHGHFAWDFNERSTKALVDFMKEPKEPPPPPEPEKPWSEQQGPVVHLDADNFKNELKKKKHAFIMFYAPWCGHCQHAKPEYISTAEQYKDDTKVMFAAVDCTANDNHELCRTQGVEGFPTFKYYSYYKNTKEYYGGRSQTEFSRFMDTQMGMIPEEQRSPAEEDWGHVKKLSLETYYDFLNSVDKTLVMFYSPNCRFCEEAKPAFVAAAAQIVDKPHLALASVNCLEQGKLCQEQRIAGYPSVVLYRKTTYVDVHRGKRVEADFVKTITTVEENADASPKPPATKPKSDKTEL